jgi:hypothetical protein
MLGDFSRTVLVVLRLTPTLPADRSGVSLC